MKQPIFTGAGVAIITPFTKEGKVNYPALKTILEYQIAHGTDAIVICGTTGESATLSHEEHTEAIRFTVETVAHRIPVIAGTGSNDTAYALHLSNEAEKIGVDGLLMVTPYYNKASQAGLIKHYTYLADRVSTPIIIYNVPSRTGCDVKPETYAELSKHKMIYAAKEASGNISSIAKTISLCEKDFTIYSGNDDQITAIMSLGGKGVISVLSNVAPQVAHDIAAAALAGDFEQSRKLQIEYLELCNALFMDVNPIPVKQAMNMMGFDAGPLRMPLCEMNEANTAKLKAVMEKYGLIK
ncbi:MAG TPA: 4-hydroxy-tetrahydrodipicolinate synthase [Candidatus Fimenecus excrementavium]|nr:4-hydroxy-tetrahydrodipicolinate synthase [Candidatus Fimenecus excrementavium]